MDNLYILYDIIAAAFLIIEIVIGMKKGFLKTVLSAAVWLAAFIGAAVVSETFSEELYLEYARPKIVSVIESELTDVRDDLKDRLSEAVGTDLSRTDERFFSEKLEEYLTDPDFSDKIKSIADPAFLKFLDGLKRSLPAVLSENVTFEHFSGSLLQITGEDSVRQAAEDIEEKAVRRFAVRLISGILWSVSYAVIGFAGKIILYAVLSLRSIDTVRSADRTLGGLLGLGMGLMFLAAAVVLLRVIAGLTDNTGFLSGECINDNTLFFKYLYNLTNLFS